MTTASIYARLSREAQDTNLSLPGMLQDCRDLAARHGITVVAEHVDDGRSGGDRDRDGLNAWIGDARSGRAQVLIAPHTDRLTREGLPVAAMVLDIVEQTGVRLLTADGLDSRDEEAFEWRFVIAATNAKHELRRITERNRANRKRLTAEKHRHVGGKAPFGTRVVERDGRKYLEPDPAEGEVLREVAQRLLRGDGMRTVVRWLNTEGHRTRRGNIWARSSLRATLLSAASREYVFDLSTFRELEKRLTRQTSERRDPGKPTGGRPQRWLLSGGSAICGSCRRRMTITHDRKRAMTRYICSSTSDSAGLCPGIVSVDAEIADAHIEKEFLARYGSGYFWEERITVVGAADLDAAERAHEAAQAALLSFPGPETLAAYQVAREAFEAAQAQPLERQVEMVATSTYAEQWEAGRPEGEGKVGSPERARLVAQALLSPVIVRPATATHTSGVRGSQVDLRRLEVTWRDPADAESTRQANQAFAAELQNAGVI